MNDRIARLRADGKTVKMTMPRRNGFGVAWSFFLSTLIAYIRGDETVEIELRDAP